MPDTVTDTIRRADRMATDRSTFESHWREVQRNMYPSGDTFIEQSTPGTKSHQAVFDSTGEQASEQLAAALIGLLTSADWFELAAEDEDLNDDPDVAVWLADSTKRMLSVFRNPNLGFATAQDMKYLDIVNYGTGGKFIDENAAGLPIFRADPLMQLFLDNNDQGRVDTVFRRFKLSARNAVNRWGGRAGDKAIKAANDAARQDDLFDFIHALGARETAARATSRFIGNP